MLFNNISNIKSKNISLTPEIYFIKAYVKEYIFRIFMLC